jgi:hypothetical protein
MRTHVKKIYSFPFLVLEILKSCYQCVLVAVEELDDTPIGWGCTYVDGCVRPCLRKVVKNEEYDMLVSHS